MTEQERAALEAMTIPQIRKAQGLVRAQQRMAYEQGNTRAMETLNQWERDYADAVYRKAFQ
jgi:hypothetical protein